MFARTLRVVTTLAAVVVAYQVYALTVVPRLEPAVAAREQRASTDVERDRGRKLVHKYQQLLASYFPADHWCQQRPPIVIKTGPLMLVLDEYRQLGPREIQLVRFAVLFFPTTHIEGGPPPPDAVIVEAPGGATLAFNDDFNPATSKLGRLESGQLDGLVTIRSDMREPGPQDDLLIETSNLKLDQNRLETFDTVTFRAGNSHGSGRQMEIRFLNEPHAAASGAAGQFDRLESLEILHDVRCQLALDSGKLTPEVSTATGRPPAKRAEPPIDIACAGSFEFLFVGQNEGRGDYVATFHDDVQVWQFNPTGQSDTMTCSKLAMEFAPTADSAKRLPLEASRRQRAELGRLQPYVLDAVGEPVILLSPSRNIEARGLHLRITLPEQRIALDGGNVRLTSGKNVMRAPAITYTHPAEDSGTRVGTFRAQGEGSLDFAPNPSKPDELLRAEWRESVHLTREDNQPVLLMNGRPRLAMTGRGELMADEMQVYLNEIAGKEKGAGSAWLGSGGGKGSGESTVVPDRLSARGNVIIDSPQLQGTTHELATWFRYEPDAEPDGADAGDSDRFTLPGRDGRQDGQQQSYAIQADLLRLEVALRGRRAVPTNLSCDGHVVFRENRTRNVDEAPLVLHGERLTVEEIDTGAARIAVIGSGAKGDEPAGQAELTARGVTLLGAAIYVEEGNSRAWINGPGEAQMRLDHDLEGRPVAGPYLVKVRWRDGLAFDGRQVELRGDVFAQGPDDWLRTDRLVGTLNQPIEFGSQFDSGNIDLAKIDCIGQVVIDHRARDQSGPTSHERMELARLAIDQQTGAIEGNGPGWVRSVRYGDESDWRLEAGGQRKSDSVASSLQPPASSLQSPVSGLQPPTSSLQPPASSQRLHFLRVEFNRGIRGNLHQRELTFAGRVRTVYGPVDAWEQQLDPDQAAGLSAGAVAVRCDELTVSEDPAHRRASAPVPARAGSLGGIGNGKFGPIELLASGNVKIESSDDKNQSIKATAERVSYDELKDVFVLEGNGRTSATIIYASGPGGQPQQAEARKITFHRGTGAWQAEDLRGVDFTPPAGAFAPATSSTPPANRRH